MKNNDFNLIKNKFDETKIELPASLEVKSIEQKIISKSTHKTIDFPKNKKRKRIFYSAAAAVAACLVMIIGLTYSLYPKDNVNKFSNYEELYNKIQQSSSAEGGSGNSGVIKRLNNAMEPCKAMADGKYIYYAYCKSDYDQDGREYAKSENCKIYVYEVLEEKSELVTVIENIFPDGYVLNELYVKNGKMVVSADNVIDNQITTTKIYDVSVPSSPKLINEFGQSGSLFKSYFVDDTAYVFSWLSITDDEEFIPKASVTGELKKLEAKDIYYIDNTNTAQYILVSAFDMKSGEKLGKTKAVYGAGYLVTLIENSAYITDYDENQNLMKVDMDGGKVKFSEANKSQITQVASDKNLIEISENRFINVDYNYPLNSGSTVTLYALEGNDIKVLDSIDIKNINAYVVDDVNEIMISGGKIALPCDFNDGKERRSGFVTIKIEGDKLIVSDEFKNNEANLVTDVCVPVGDYIYSFNTNHDALDNKVDVFSFKH